MARQAHQFADRAGRRNGGQRSERHAGLPRSGRGMRSSSGSSTGSGQPIPGTTGQARATPRRRSTGIPKSTAETLRPAAETTGIQPWPEAGMNAGGRHGGSRCDGSCVPSREPARPTASAERIRPWHPASRRRFLFGCHRESARCGQSNRRQSDRQADRQPENGPNRSLKPPNQDHEISRLSHQQCSRIK